MGRDQFVRVPRRSLWEVAAGCLAALGYLILRAAGVHIVVLTGSQRAVLYQTLAGAAIGLLAFGITPAVIILTLAPGERIKALLRHHGDEIRRSIVRALWAVLILLVVTIVALAIDQADPGATWIRYAVLAASAGGLVAVVRLVSQFAELMPLISQDKVDGESKRLQPVATRDHKAG